MITLTLPIPPSTNNLYENGRRGRYRSQKYDAWIEEAIYSLGQQKIRDVIIGAFAMQIRVPMNLRGDITNRIKAPEDFLVNQGLIPDDRYAFKVSIERGDVEECEIKVWSIKTGAA